MRYKVKETFVDKYTGQTVFEGAVIELADERAEELKKFVKLAEKIKKEAEKK